MPGIIFFLHTQEASLTFLSVPDNPNHSCALFLMDKEGRGGKSQMLCFVPGFKSSICCVCGTICCPLCHGKDGAGFRSVTGHKWNYIPFLGLMHPNICFTVIKANATPPPSKSLFSHI